MEGAPAALPPGIAEHDRLYRLVKLTGWTVDQIGDTPAVTLDWLLEVDQQHRQAAQNAAEKAQKAANERR